MRANDSEFRKEVMHSATSGPQSIQWLLDSGLEHLKLLFRAIVFQPAEPILIADNDRNYRDASCGAGKLFGLPRNKIIGRRIDDLRNPASGPKSTNSGGPFWKKANSGGRFGW